MAIGDWQLAYTFSSQQSVGAVHWHLNQGCQKLTNTHWCKTLYIYRVLQTIEGLEHLVTLDTTKTKVNQLLVTKTSGQLLSPFWLETIDIIVAPRDGKSKKNTPAPILGITSCQLDHSYNKYFFGCYIKWSRLVSY